MRFRFTSASSALLASSFYGLKWRRLAQISARRKHAIAFEAATLNELLMFNCAIVALASCQLSGSVAHPSAARLGELARFRCRLNPLGRGLLGARRSSGRGDSRRLRAGAIGRNWASTHLESAGLL